MALTNFWVCSQCGFVNTPHAFRRGDANAKCEQDGSPRDAKELDPVTGLPTVKDLHSDIAPADAVIAKRG